AYFLLPIENTWQDAGSGMVGTLPEPLDPPAFLAWVRDRLGARVIRHTPYARPVRRVAVCGGAGSFLLRKVRAAGADAFVTSDFKYHEFFDAEGALMIADVGHWESEQHTPALMRQLLTEKMGNIAAYLSETDTNPVRYFF
ncbi:MAG: Nif3-like dinuclear metal center hexameric protein, partial [Catalinimonas sp.]